MNVADWAQTLSLPLVALALFASAVQTRAMVQQTRFSATQSRHVADSLAQNAQIALTRNQTDHRAEFFRDDPELLEWYLSSRGYPTSAYENNKRSLYVLTRMDIHQLNFLNYESGFLANEFWGAWKNVVVTDLEIPEFADLWPTVRTFYAPGFVAFCDSVLAARAAKPTNVATGGRVPKLA
ncbi:hypothetical protein BJ973_001499 [Actinoplanes tereljensis]|uniref:Uncharacterized protein n=1 Tax=Paractinoplanes tereljensis TaxID=571912 RepID=A0A919NM11_9ACTN|nr:hypothetical protein [Actinoplanes tereljensis]GIF20595.1 hypothetical protein Ate02nite_33250 [Actinoplanes tereljensis]